MGDWVTILGVVGLVLFGGAAVIVFMVRMISRKPEPRPSISEADVQLLQETVEMLIDRLKSASDEAVHEIDLRQQELQALLERADARMSELVREVRTSESRTSGERIHPGEVSRWADEGLDESEIAQRTGITRGEVELMLELQAMRK